MAWLVNSSGTPTTVNAAINALVETDQSTAANAQLVRAKAIMLAEVTAVGGSYVTARCFGSMIDNNSFMKIEIQRTPFVDATKAPVTELAPNPLP